MRPGTFERRDVAILTNCDLPERELSVRGVIGALRGVRPELFPDRGRAGDDLAVPERLAAVSKGHRLKLKHELGNPLEILGNRDGFLRVARVNQGVDLSGSA